MRLAALQPKPKTPEERVTISDQGMRVHVLLDGKSVARFTDDPTQSAAQSAKIYRVGLIQQLKQEGDEQ